MPSEQVFSYIVTRSSYISIYIIILIVIQPVVFFTP